MRKLFLVILCAGLLFGGYKLFSSTLFSPGNHFIEYAVGEKFTVQFSYPDLAMEEFSDREKGDQARDWMLYTLLSNSGLERKEFAEAVFDMPPVRYGFNNSLGNFEFGETRSKFIGKGQVIALIPISNDKKRTDNIGHVLDEIRKNQGEIPKKVYLFEYDLNIEGKFAHITRLENIDAGTFFTEASGYYESTIRSLEDLKTFMGRIDDVTYAKRESNIIILGGRHMFDQTYGKATVEDIAAIWQSEKDIMNGQPQNEMKEKELETVWNGKMDTVIQHYNKALKELSFSDGSSFEDLSPEDQNLLVEYVESTVFEKKEEIRVALLDLSFKTDAAVLAHIAKMKKDVSTIRYGYASAMQEFKSEGVASASGFSLDPAVNFEESIAFVNEHIYWFEEALQPQFTVDQMIEQLEHKQGDLFQYAIANLRKLDGAEELETVASNRCIYQKARYDGSLEGTQVGMTLFYTDLMAKIWTINSLHSKPTDFISGFKDDEQSYMMATRVFKEESSSLPAVRLWFGPNKNGFQCSQTNSELSFSRNATQIFALSNNPGSPDVISEDGQHKNLEQQASAEFDIALSWWNNHFEEVAGFEHQYERLNEIMKWSTIIGWINSDYQNSSLDFLAEYPVHHDNWFPDWARSQKDLKFNNWENVPFHTRGYLNNKTEAIPILYSPNKIISGGVSLAEKSLLREAPEILKADKALFRRANIIRDEIGENAFITHNETKFTLLENTQTKSFNIDVQAKEGYKLRNRFGEIENTQFRWDLIEEPNGTFTFSSKMGNVPIGDLHYSKTGENAFTIGFESRTIDKGMCIAKQSSDYSGELETLLANHPQVEKYLSLENGDWCIKMKNAEEWMVMRVHPEMTKAAVNLETGWQARTSGNRLFSKNVDLKWVNEAEVINLNKGAPLPSFKNTADLLDESPAGLRQKLLDTKGKQGVDAELAIIKKKNITEAEELATINEFEKASAKIEKVIRHFGETPQLTKLRVNYELRAGLTAWENGNRSTAINHLNDAITTQPFAVDRSDIFREVDRLISEADIDPYIKTKITEMAKFYKTDEQMIISGFWEGYKPLAKQVSLDQAISAKGGKIIYEDNATFSNIDPSLPFETIIGNIRSIPDIQVYDITAEAIGKNTRMYASLEPQLALGIPVQRLKFRVHPGSSIKNCIDRDNDGKCDDSYTVPGPVYYVTTTSKN